MTTIEEMAREQEEIQAFKKIQEETKTFTISGKEWKALELFGKGLLHVLVYGLYTIIAFLSWIAMKADYRWFTMTGNDYGSFMWVMGALFMLSFAVLLKLGLNDAEDFMKLRELEKKADDND